MCCLWGGTSHGLPVPVTARSGNTITVNSGGAAVVFGLPFTSSMTLSRLYMRDAEAKLKQTSPFRVRRLYIHVSNTAYSRAFVQPYRDGPIFTKQYTPLTLNDAAFDPDRVILGDGFFSLPIKARSDRVRVWMENDTVYPDVVTGVEWEGDYDIRARNT